jgi:hypothetical protein
MGIRTDYPTRIRYAYDVFPDNSAPVRTSTTIKADCWKDAQTNPRWRAAIKRGQVVIGPYSRTSFNVLSSSPFAAQIVSNDGTPGAPHLTTGSVRGDLYDLPSSAGQASSARTLALTRAYKRLSEQQTHAKGMQFLGEFHEVIRQFKRPYSSAVRLIDTYLERAASAARRYRPRSQHGMKQARKNLQKALSDSWLETAFGLQPLIADTRDLAEAAARMSNDRRRDVVVASATVQIAGSTKTLIDNFIGVNIGLRREIREVETHSTAFRVFCDWTRSAALGSIGRLQELVGFRADLFVPTLYELTPYSFLVDYFSNLGDVIETGCQSLQEVKGSVETVRNTVVSTQLMTPFGTVPSRIVTSNFQPGSAKLRRTYFLRTAGLGTLPQVPFQLSLPGSPMKYLNMLALVASKTSKIQNSWNTAPHKDVF